jgi:hypothetical protein
VKRIAGLDNREAAQRTAKAFAVGGWNLLPQIAHKKPQ